MDEGLLKKLQDESDIKNHKKDSQLARSVHIELRSPNFIEAGFDRLETFKKDHIIEIDNLKNLLLKQNNNISSKDLDLLKACHSSVDSSLLKLKDKLFTIDEL